MIERRVGQITERRTPGFGSIIDRGCKVTHNANQSITSGLQTTLNFNTEVYDKWGMHDTAVNNQNIVIPIAGVYYVTACIEWAASNAGDYRDIGIYLSGSNHIAQNRIRAASAVNTTRLNIGVLYRFAANDIVYVWVKQDSGGALNVVTNSYTPQFAVQLVAR
jgi:hypothetical protein